MQSPSRDRAQLICRRWTAVFRGAVLCGIEKNNHRNISQATPCPKNYGIVLNEPFSANALNGRDRNKDPLANKDSSKNQLTWPILKGDLILSNETRVSEKECHFYFTETESRKFKYIVYEYDDDEDVPSSLKYEDGE